MRNILLVEPKYKTKFPPIGLLKISSYHKSIGDHVTLIRGMDTAIKSFHWDRIYISALFTYELNTTIKTIKYYSGSVDNNSDLIVGGVVLQNLCSYLPIYSFWAFIIKASIMTFISEQYLF